MSKMNRIANTKNAYQCKYKKVLCICSAGLLRSPTAALVLSQDPFNYNTRACGINCEYALIEIDDVLIEWADEIVCMEKEHARILEKYMIQFKKNKPIINLEIEDDFEYRDPKLMELIKTSYLEKTKT
jgi:predicted protein tyrosine phosphatase